MALKFRRILCPVDLSKSSLQALELAAQIAESSRANLYVLHVIDNPFDELYMSSITQADPALVDMYKKEPMKRSRVLSATVRHSQIMVKQFCQDTVAAVPNVRYVVESGHPFDRIIDVAESRRADLLVLATHGRTGLRRMLIGNIAEKVVRHAPCPVLTVKGKTRRANQGRRSARR